MMIINKSNLKIFKRNLFDKKYHIRFNYLHIIENENIVKFIKIETDKTSKADEERILKMNEVVYF